MANRSTWKLTTQQRDTLPRLYRGGKSIMVLARQFHVSPTAVYSLLRRRHEPIRSFRQSHLRFRCNETFFDAICTDAQAYWLGFLMADGTINGKRGVVLSLQMRDIAHLYRLRRALKGTHPVRRYRYLAVTFARIVLTSPKLVYALARYGMKTPRPDGFPRHLPRQWRTAFIRGYFDGDGSIFSIMVKKRYVRSTVSICGGNYDLLIALQKYLPVSSRLRRHKAIWDLRIDSWRDLKKFNEWLYEGATVWLPRKRKRLDELMIARECAFCGVQFIPRRFRSRGNHCSKACYQRTYRSSMLTPSHSK